MVRVAEPVYSAFSFFIVLPEILCGVADGKWNP